MHTFFSEAFSEPNILFPIFLLLGVTELLVVFFNYRHRKGQEKGGILYHPVFQFRTLRNQMITQRSKQVPILRLSKQVMML
jgi:hypothetical protein